uniref:Putative mucin-19 isoform x2 n=1 Tax=Lutzomyia longipalpis TaxID=7200 RepID=A0A1B0CJA0_LUTLO
MAKENTGKDPDELLSVLGNSDGVVNGTVEEENSESFCGGENNGPAAEAPKKDENPFSLKHFLNRDNAGISSSTNRGPGTSNSSNLGARPKVFQSTSTNEIPKMKRSPRFPSFDSQASLTEYTDDLRSSIGTTSSNFGKRSYSNYDIESPNSPRPERRGKSPIVPSSSARNTSTSNVGGGGHRLGNSEFSAALPDFVQDHLIIEQLYNHSALGSSGSPNTSPLSVDFDIIPGFAVNDTNSRPSAESDMPFDLMFTTSSAPRSRSPLHRNSPTIPLDLPVSSSASSIPLDLTGSRFGHNTPPPPDIPLDLTERHDFGNANQPPADMIQTLPDFLSDGPIHSGRLADVTSDLPHLDSPEESAGTTIARLRLENERLRHELDDNRRRLSEKTRQSAELERTLESMRHTETQYSATLAESMEQVEENLDRSNKRAAAAQQLLTGVDNLRIMAANIQNMDRICDPTDEFLSDCDDEDFTGPAL